MNRIGRPYVFGQQPAPAPPEENTFTIVGLEKGIKAITPTLIFVGIATGVAFALGSALAERYILKRR